MTSVVLIGAAAVAIGLVVVLSVAAGPLRTWGNHSIGILRRRHLVVFAVALTLPACTAMVVSLAGRVKLNDEIRARVAIDTRRIRDDQITRAQVAGIAQTQAMLLRPTLKERLRRINEALKACAEHETCRVEFVRTVNRIVRSPAGSSFTVAPPKGLTRPPAPAPPPPRTIVVPGPPAAAGKDGRDGKDGRPGKSVDSAVVDGLDNRIAGVEGLVQGLVGRIVPLEKLTAALCRLLTPGRCG